MKARHLGARLLWIIAFAFVFGVSVGGVELIFRLLAGRGLPRWSLLTYLTAAFALGLGPFSRKHCGTRWAGFWSITIRSLTVVETLVSPSRDSGGRRRSGFGGHTGGTTRLA